MEVADAHPEGECPTPKGLSETGQEEAYPVLDTNMRHRRGRRISPQEMSITSRMHSGVNCLDGLLHRFLIRPVFQQVISAQDGHEGAQFSDGHDRLPGG